MATTLRPQTTGADAAPPSLLPGLAVAVVIAVGAAAVLPDITTAAR